MMVEMLTRIDVNYVNFWIGWRVVLDCVWTFVASFAVMSSTDAIGRGVARRERDSIEICNH